MKWVEEISNCIQDIKVWIFIVLYVHVKGVLSKYVSKLVTKDCIEDLCYDFFLISKEFIPRKWHKPLKKKGQEEEAN